MNQSILLKRLLLLFWALWLSVVFLTNLADAAKELHWLAGSWAFASGNFQLIKETTARYATPDWLNGVLFAGVIMLEGTAAMLFWVAGWSFRDRRSGHRAVCQAFTASLLLWAGFLVADEVFVAYRFAGTHLGLFMAHLLTLLAIELVPDSM